MGTESNKTIYILGAGSGVAMKMPTGDQLKEFIVKQLNFSPDPLDLSGSRIINKIIASSNSTHEGHFKACERIVEALLQAPSIDEFMNERDDKDINYCSKLAIAEVILERERNTTIKNKKLRAGIGSYPVISNLQNIWFHKFWNVLKQGCTVETLPDQLKSVLIINFNYDRCLEQYLFLALKNYYTIDDNKVAEKLGNLKIFHPYGKIGSLPWEKIEDDMCPIEFGGQPNNGQLLELAKQIRTFGESESFKGLESIHKDILASKKLIFLGFAFHKINMELLFPISKMSGDSFGKNKRKMIIATTKGISMHHADYIKQNFTQRFDGTDGALSSYHIVGDLDCEEAFQEYRPYMNINDATF